MIGLQDAACLLSFENSVPTKATLKTMKN